MDNLSRHAEIRLRQRGVRTTALALLLEWHDEVLFAGGGRVSAFLSKSGAEGLLSEGYPPATVDAARRLSLILDGDTGTVVTVLRRMGSIGRRYFRQMPTKKH